MPEPNTELIVLVLINGATFATVAVIVPADDYSRTTYRLLNGQMLFR
jgi:hypothetical protein